jgi:chromosome segregation ATPase
MTGSGGSVEEKKLVEGEKEAAEEALSPLVAWLKHRAIYQVGFNEVIEQDLNKINATLEIHGKLLVKLDGRVAGLGHQVTALDGRVTVLDQKVTVLDQKVTVLDQKVTVLDQNVTVLDQKVTALDQKVTALDEKIVGMDKRFERRFVGLEDKFVGLEDKMDTVLKLLTGRSEPLVPSARVASD